ncbi:MAG: LamB/YcsF family protein [Verrucomicrobiota bacterium]
MEVNLIINCDLGENEPPTLTAKLMPWIDAANIACGGHAGSKDSMKRCLDLCLEHSVFPGAHPGIDAEFGRGTSLPRPKEFSELLNQQWNDLSQVAEKIGTKLHHIKLHGSLYHAVENDSAFQEIYIDFLANQAVSPVVLSRSGGMFAQRCKDHRLPVWEELFADRAYLEDGQLAPRNQENAIIHDPSEVGERISDWLSNHSMKTINGNSITLSGQTLCVHSDSPQSLEIARKLNALINS